MAVNAQKSDYQFKILEVGDSGVGKSNLMLRYTVGKFEENYSPAIAQDFQVRLLTLPNGKTVKLQIWDTAGTEKFRTITSSYYRGSHGVFIVYDITNRETFDVVGTWKQEVDKYCGDDVVILVGNKTDLASKREVSTLEGQQAADHHNLPFIETSAKTGDNVEKMFQILVDELMKKNVPVPPQPLSTLKVEEPPKDEEKKKKKKGGCMI